MMCEGVVRVYVLIILKLCDIKVIRCDNVRVNGAKRSAERELLQTPVLFAASNSALTHIQCFTYQPAKNRDVYIYYML